VETGSTPWVDALRRSRGSLRALIEPLHVGQLQQRSHASEWSIAQVLSHIGAQAEIFSLFLDAGLGGQDPPGLDAFPPIWEVRNSRSPRAQAAGALPADNAVVERFESLDAHRSNHCANRDRWCRLCWFLRGWAAWSGDSEHGDDSFLGDAYLGDQGFDGGLALGGCAGVEDVVQVGAELLDCVGRGCGGLVADGVGDLVVAGLELVDLGAQGGDAGASGGVVHGAVLECGEVPVDRGLLVLDLGEDGIGFGVPVSVGPPRCRALARVTASVMRPGAWV
jgi:hypothetical protein